MNIALFANLRTTGRRTAPAVRTIAAHMAGIGFRPTVFAARYLSQLSGLISKLRPERFDAIACLGGDGTHFHVLNGLIRRFGIEALPPVAVIPMGRGNSFARDLNLFSAADTVAALAAGNTRRVDLCRFSCNGSDSVFANLMGLGFVADAAATAARFARAGDLSYVIGVFYRMLSLRPQQVQLEIDGRDFSGPFCFLELCNSRYTGGSMLMAPNARLDDEAFDAVLVGPMTSIQLLRAFPLIYQGGHLAHGAVRVIQGKTARISTSLPLGLLPDGELLGTTPVDIQVLPRCARYFTR